MTDRWRFISDHHMEYGIQRLSRMAVFSWLAWYNNPRRRHSALSQLSPVEFERQAITSRSLNLAA